MWTNNRMQDNRGMGHPYPGQPLASGNTPWQTTGGMLPDGRQMLAGWRPPTAVVNGLTPTAPGVSIEQKQESVDMVNSNIDRAQTKLPNDKGTDGAMKDNKTESTGVGEHKDTGIKH